MNRRAANGDSYKRTEPTDDGSMTAKGKILQPLLSHQRNVPGTRQKDLSGAKSGAARISNGGNFELPQNLFIAHANNTDAAWG